MTNYLIEIQYDATSYNGWQRQDNTSNTIQETMEVILSKYLHDNIKLHASGRTDSGVHAKSQVATFKSSNTIDLCTFINNINNILPETIKINNIKIVDNTFHARLSAISKTYKYSICTSEHHTVFRRKYMYNFNKSLDINAMNKACHFLIGEHDFKAFTNSKNPKISTIRTINSIYIDNHSEYIEIYINGNGFLYNMVRIICGTLLLVGTHEIKPEDITTIINSKNRDNSGPMLPAHGLFLWNVYY